MTDDDIDPSVASVASVGHTGGGHYVLAAAACATAFIWVQAKLVQQVLSNPQPRRSFTPCGHPSGKRLSARCSRKRNPSNGSTAGGQPAGVFLVLRPSSTHPVGCLSTGEPFSVRIDSIFF